MIKKIVIGLVVLLFVCGINGSINSNYTTLWKPENKNQILCTGSLTLDGNVLLAIGDTTLIKGGSTIYAFNVSSNSKIEIINNITITESCYSTIISWSGNTFFHVCNFQSSGYGPTTFNLIQYENNELTILKTITVPSNYGYFNPILGTFPAAGFLYIAASTGGGDKIGYYLFDVSNTFTLKLIGVRNNPDTSFCPNAIVSPDQSYIAASLYTNVAHLEKFSLPNLQVISNSAYPPGGQYVFSIPTNKSYASFWIGPKNTRGLVYQNMDFNNWVEGAVVTDTNSTYFSGGISYVQTNVDNCFYVTAYSYIKNSFATITQVGLTSSLTTPQKFIAQITWDTQPILLAAGSSAIYISHYGDDPVIYTFPVSCPANN